MPRPALPLTPASSTEIRGRDQIEHIIDDLALPPSALHGNHIDTEASVDVKSDLQSNRLTNAKRKRKSQAMTTEIQSPTSLTPVDATFTLPPPPSRSRKIIQVQPEEAKGSSRYSTQPRKKGDAGKSSAKGGAAKPTASSRKTARKTAHSIIERRRRSKMNEEFETLKELVPAARGQSMHKLAILQAGIEYVRYLEDCVKGLQSAQFTLSCASSTPYRLPDEIGTSPVDAPSEEDVDEAEDEEMEDEEEDRGEESFAATTPRASRPASGYTDHRSLSDTPSPTVPAGTYNSSSSYAFSTGSPSPAILPSLASAYGSTANSSTLPSPALLPQHDSKTPQSILGSSVILPSASNFEYHALQAHAKQALASHGEEDQEVITTLAMMGTERRRSQEEKDRSDGTRGMSVRDLLSG